jgi:hypothetical protein
LHYQQDHHRKNQRLPFFVACNASSFKESRIACTSSGLNHFNSIDNLAEDCQGIIIKKLPDYKHPFLASKKRKL